MLTTTINDNKSENSDIKSFRVRVLYISKNIMAKAFDLRDKNLMSHEKRYTEEEIKNKVISLAIMHAKDNINGKHFLYCQI